MSNLLVHRVDLKKASVFFATGRGFSRRKAEQFTYEFNDLFSGDNTLDEAVYDLILWNKAHTLLPAIYHGLIGALEQGDTKGIIEMADLCYAHLGIKFDFTDVEKVHADLDRLARQVQHFQRKVRNLEPAKQSDDFDLERLIISVELALSLQIARTHSVHQFHRYYEKAVAISQKNRKANG